MQRSNWLRLRLAALCATSCIACGTDGDDGAVQGYLQGLPPWSQFSPQSADTDAVLKPGEVFEKIFDGQKYSCRNSTHSLTANPDEIVIFQPDRNVLWPGALLQGKGYLGGVGSLKELPIRQRAPLKVFIDLLGENVTDTVAEPDAASLSQAISRLVAKAKAQMVNPQLRVSFSTTSYANTNQSALKLGLSAKFLGIGVDSKLNVARDSSMNAVLADLKASAFTVSVVAPQTPAAMFSKDFTKEHLDEQIALGNLGPDNIPVYVSSVTYGKRFLYNVTSKASTEEISAAIHASMKWVGLQADVEARYRSILNERQLGLVMIGGSEQQLRDAINQGIEGYFGSQTQIDSWVPISYEVRNLGDGSLAKMSETTQYELRECVPTGAKQHKVEIQLVDVYKSAYAVAHPAGRSATTLLDSRGDSQRTDVSAYMTAPGDQIVIGNTGGSTDIFNPFHRRVLLRVWVDGSLVNETRSECSRCHSTDRAIVFTINQDTGNVIILERN